MGFTEFQYGGGGGGGGGVGGKERTVYFGGVRKERFILVSKSVNIWTKVVLLASNGPLSTVKTLSDLMTLNKFMSLSVSLKTL